MGKTPAKFIDDLLSRLGAGQVGRGAILSLGIRVTMIMLGFVQAVLLARLLGPEQYGVFSIVLSASSVVASLGLFGLGELAVREVSRLSAQGNHAALRGFIRFALGTVMLLSAAGGLMLFGYSAFSTAALSEFRWAVLIVPAMAMLLLLRGTAQGFSEIFHAQAPTDLIRPGLMALLLVTIFLLNAPISANIALGLLACANLLGLGIAGIFLTKILKKKPAPVAAKSSRAQWIKGGLPFLGLGVLATVQGEVNTLMLGTFSTPREAGLFQPVVKLLPIMVLALYAINVPLAPRVSTLWERGDLDKLKETVWAATRASSTVTIALAALLLLSAPAIFQLFGAEYAGASSSLFWLAIAQCLNALCGSVGVLLNMTGHQKHSALSLLGAVMINISLGYALIPAHGAHGAAIALATSIVSWNLLMLMFVKSKLGFSSSAFAALQTHRPT